jgi:hypothetical protein
VEFNSNGTDVPECKIYPAADVGEKNIDKLQRKGMLG